MILYDRDSASAFSDPMPNQWASQAEGAQFRDPLSDQELVKLGREPFARKVAAAREAGVDAWGWLASDHGTDALVAYARDHGADLILLPADLEDPGLGERLKGETVDKAVEEARRPPPAWPSSWSPPTAPPSSPRRRLRTIPAMLRCSTTTMPCSVARLVVSLCIASRRRLAARPWIRASRRPSPVPPPRPGLAAGEFPADPAERP